MKTNRRSFLKSSTAASAGIMIGGLGMSAKSYGRILGANDRISVGILGFSDRFNGVTEKSLSQVFRRNEFRIHSPGRFMEPEA